MRRQLLLLVFSVLVVALLGEEAWSARPSYPSRAIEFVVPFAPGGSSDVAGRIIAKYLSAELGVPVNVTNKGGGNQVPAAMYVLAASANGYVLLEEGSSVSSAHAVVKDLPYKWDDRAFGPMMVTAPHAFVVSGKSPWKSLGEVVEAAKKDPGSFTWTYLGGGTTTDFVITQALAARGVDVMKTKAVAFDGGGPGMVAVAGGHVLFTAVGASATLPLRASGDLRVLAVTGDSRASSLPDVPTVKEAGFPEITMKSWWGISGPKALPKEIIDRLDQAAKKIVADPAYIKDHNAVSNQPRYMPAAEVKEYVMKEAQQLKEIVNKLQLIKKK